MDYPITHRPVRVETTSKTPLRKVTFEIFDDQMVPVEDELIAEALTRTVQVLGTENISSEL